jgi:hypothetical protein
MVVIGLVLVGALASVAAAQTAATPALTASPPQQMPASGTPAYPSTPSAYPSTTSAYPSTFPASYPSTYPSTHPSTYPSTSPSLPASGAAPLVAPASASLTPAVPLGNSVTPANAEPLYKPFGSPEAMAAVLAGAPAGSVEQFMTSEEPWVWQLMPTGLMYRSYLAGNKEPRLGSQLVHERNLGWLWDATVGGRVGILRYGTQNDLWPQGWQFDIEGAAFPRLDLEHNEDLVDVDIRGGLLLTTRQGHWEGKFGFYHLSSHIGDEYLLRYPDFPRLNYVRDSLILGVAYYLNPSLRLYSEAGWCFHEDGGAGPWEFQFGVDYSSPDPTGISGAPFFAINTHLRQENDFGGNLTVQTGWQWRGRTGHLLRVGMQYFNGMSDQYQFYNVFEEQIGFGLWYDY